ncbi:unnamed protein product [Zymoseptoria tritici ST99CH_1A5]|uniref:Uncharacterized protein n=1 Tax=Zymoseptoria tritici ST99CH_1A5 TaxID=1276529 RepID=A0A1Y6LSE0_ZYMTR|nr:unnamed protein product [Zymoseptoria tritici ST99CH_3D1]SMY26370.1 unnamed protein product [Zymoseptoria tritici ST99CH_1A5]
MDNDLSEVMVDYECGRVAVQIIVQRLCRLERDHDHLTGSGSQFAASWIAVIMLKTSVRMCTAQAYSLASLVREYWAERYRAFCLNLVFTPSLGLPEFDDGIDNLAKMSMKHFRDLLNRVVTISIRQLEISGTIAEVRYIEQQLESACFSMQWKLTSLRPQLTDSRRLPSPSTVLAQGQNRDDWSARQDLSEFAMDLAPPEYAEFDPLIDSWGPDAA